MFIGGASDSDSGIRPGSNGNPRPPAAPVRTSSRLAADDFARPQNASRTRVDRHRYSRAAVAGEIRSGEWRIDEVPGRSKPQLELTHALACMAIPCVQKFMR